jgi:Family of unknown function (DUF5367)
VSGGKILALVALGAVFWLLGVVTVRFAGAQGAFVGDNTTVIIYAATPFVMLALLAGVCAWLHIDGRSRLTAATLMAATALLLDGVAVRWFSDIYGAGDAVLGGAAWLLWAVGCTFVVALLTRKTLSL